MRKMRRRGNKNKILETKEHTERMWAGGWGEGGRKYLSEIDRARASQWVSTSRSENG